MQGITDAHVAVRAELVHGDEIAGRRAATLRGEERATRLSQGFQYERGGQMAVRRDARIRGAHELQEGARLVVDVEHAIEEQERRRVRSAVVNALARGGLCRPLRLDAPA